MMYAIVYLSGVATGVIIMLTVAAAIINKEMIVADRSEQS